MVERLPTGQLLHHRSVWANKCQSQSSYSTLAVLSNKQTLARLEWLNILHPSATQVRHETSVGSDADPAASFVKYAMEEETEVQGIQVLDLFVHKLVQTRMCCVKREAMLILNPRD